MKATVEIYEQLPNKSSVVIDVPNFGVFVRGFDGKKAWYQDPLDGYIPFTGYLFREAQLDADFLRPIKLNSLYQSLSVVGRVRLGERDAYLVLANQTGLRTQSLYFDAASGLLLRKGETYYEDYRAVDGVMLPFKIKESPFTAVGTTFTLTEIKHNVEIEEAKFAPYPSCLIGK
jgi:hypothetical protein